MFLFGVFLREGLHSHTGLSVDTHMYQLKAHIVNSLRFSLLGRRILLGRPTGSRRSITGLFREMDQRTALALGPYNTA